MRPSKEPRGDPIVSGVAVTDDATRIAASEYGAKGIRINSILLGVIDSGQWSRRYEALPDKSVSREDWLAGLAREAGVDEGGSAVGDGVTHHRVEIEPGGCDRAGLSRSGCRGRWPGDRP